MIDIFDRILLIFEIVLEVFLQRGIILIYYISSYIHIKIFLYQYYLYHYIHVDIFIITIIYFLIYTYYQILYRYDFYKNTNTLIYSYVFYLKEDISSLIFSCFCNKHINRQLDYPILFIMNFLCNPYGVSLSENSLQVNLQ